MISPGRLQLQDIGAAADAVLVDDCDRDRPELVRRALRVVTADTDGVHSLRATVGDSPTIALVG